MPPCTAGMGVEPSSCGQGRYCDTSAGQCAECAALDRLQFGAPVPLGLAPTNGITQMFPRSNADTGDLFLVLQAMQPVYQTQIASAVAVKGPPSWMAPAPLAALAGTNQDTGPLYLQSTATLAGLVDPSIVKAAEPALLFDSDRIPGKRKVFALLLGSTTIAVPVVLALPGGTTATNESNVAVAPAASPPRYFWLSDTGAQPVRLVTALTSDASPADLPLTLDDGCPAPLAAMPWVTPGGEWILFAGTRPDPASNCAAPPADAPTHLYAARLNAHGQQAGKAVPSSVPPTPTSTTAPRSGRRASARSSSPASTPRAASAPSTPRSATERPRASRDASLGSSPTGAARPPIARCAGATRTPGSRRKIRGRCAPGERGMSPSGPPGARCSIPIDFSASPRPPPILPPLRSLVGVERARRDRATSPAPSSAPEPARSVSVMTDNSCSHRGGACPTFRKSGPAPGKFFSRCAVQQTDQLSAIADVAGLERCAERHRRALAPCEDSSVKNGMSSFPRAGPSAGKDLLCLWMLLRPFAARAPRQERWSRRSA